MYGMNIEEIDLSDKKQVDEIKDFLAKFDLKLDDNVDYTIAIRLDGNIKATCSKAKNVFKCFAVSPELQGEGISNKLITALNNKLFEEGTYHNFIFTKPKNKQIFTSMNYKDIYEVENVCLLENGVYDINKYLDKIADKYNIDNTTEKSALVMNCNPFTLGHRYLIECAARKSKEVLVFIVEEDKSLFPFKYRYELVKKGVSDLENVKVIPGGEYIISSATFPSYFLRKEDEVLKAYTNIDAGIFAKYFCSRFNITDRFVGEEPYCNVTRAYNNALNETLNKYGVKLHIINRKENAGIKISASMVRELIKEDQYDKMKELIPSVTWEFLNSNEGREIMEKIKVSNSPH
ncbi:[citrate [pro-3S]-lyase] ligase [Clostridium tepidiprofundi DSM 19306]|uniref:[Citrate [pro-3S]-lyase] ligase n=1 Tax=Clostridium tepidiprofundi DSM 19306 TaxID=1121338 RepID=A0A151B5R2_9CLOT|nr:[citrate (pro-3S)-lyase] ligase [Clostridium tepidiprofundi]KYH35226.1 [citrate [pro-3S]-lyase] ligase [Clostridium tepidiprofundi DSM 19306]